MQSTQFKKNTNFQRLEIDTNYLKKVIYSLNDDLETSFYFVSKEIATEQFLIGWTLLVDSIQYNLQLNNHFRI